MREIKFRAYYKNYEDKYKMIYEGTEDWKDFCIVNGKLYAIQYDNPLYKLNAILMQYTGLKDKNDKEIYEGDIVKFEFYKPFYKELEIKTDVIQFKDGKFSPIPYYFDCEDDYFSYEFELRNFEVIGNIYERNFLLETEDHKQKIEKDKKIKRKYIIDKNDLMDIINKRSTRLNIAKKYNCDLTTVDARLQEFYYENPELANDWKVLDE